MLSCRTLTFAFETLASLPMVSDAIDQLRNAVRDVPNFPKHGIVFKDIMPILVDAELFNKSIEVFLDRCRGKTKSHSERARQCQTR